MKKIFLIKVDGKFIKVPEVLNETLLQLENIKYQDLKRIAFSFKNFTNSLGYETTATNYNQEDNEIIQFCEKYLSYSDEHAEFLNFQVGTLEQFFISLCGDFYPSEFIQLMNLGADVNYIDFYGETLLYKYVNYYLRQWHRFGDIYLENCKILLEYGADPYIELGPKKSIFKSIKNSKSKGKHVMEDLFREYENRRSAAQSISTAQAGSSQQLTAAELEQLKK